jgi:hypothetical protein
MRRSALAIGLVLAPARVHADDDVRALVAADTYVARAAGATDEADVAWSAHVEWRGDERAAVLDWVDRESLIGGAPRRELHEASYVDRSLDHLALTVGRFRVPGGYWLMADGGEVAGRWDELELGVFGGNRSFTNGRAETLLTSSRHPLPLVGAAITTRGDVQAALSYTWTSDLVALPRGLGANFTSQQPEQFVDAELVAPIGDNVFATGGATVASRYLVTYSAAPDHLADDPQLASVWLGSASAYALVDLRAGEWRLDATAAATRTTLGQGGAMPELAAVIGSYVEGTLRATLA